MDQAPPPPPVITVYHDRLLQIGTTREGVDPILMNSVLELMNIFLNSCVPRAPVYAQAYLSADFSSSGDGTDEDRISGLPDDILRDVISRLPAKDAARTTALSSRWRPLWTSVPLRFFDFHLLPGTGDDDNECLIQEAESSIIAAALTRLLEVHPGPFRTVYLSSVDMYPRGAELGHWMFLLATKRVEELVLVHRQWPFDLPLPSAIISLASVRRLYLGNWRFPDTTALRRGGAFPQLEEIGLGHVIMEDEDLAFILARSPALKSLVISSSQKEVNLRIISSTLRCVQVCLCLVPVLAVVDAPCLERLFLSKSIRCLGGDRGGTKIKFARAPNLRIVGFLVPGVDVLEVGNTVIKVGTEASSDTIVPSVRILALKVSFDARNEAKMLPSFLRCFPNVEVLHIESQQAMQPKGNLKHKFWKDTSRIECVRSHIREMVFYGYRGEKSEIAFLKFILEKARVLQKIEIAPANGSRGDVATKLANSLSSVAKANENCSVVFSDICRRGSSSWNCEVASDFSVADPFANFYN